MNLPLSYCTYIASAIPSCQLWSSADGNVEHLSLNSIKSSCNGCLIFLVTFTLFFSFAAESLKLFSCHCFALNSSQIVYFLCHGSIFRTPLWDFGRKSLNSRSLLARELSSSYSPHPLCSEKASHLTREEANGVCVSVVNWGAAKSFAESFSFEAHISVTSWGTPSLLVLGNSFVSQRTLRIGWANRLVFFYYPYSLALSME